ncbi:MAG: AAA family ATPase, partial [Planctomycetia bacterium]|nr:AAA family ATPase [Planctomycetia bacterium]
MDEYQLEWSSGAGLTRRPFLIHPDPSRFIPLGESERIRTDLSRCVARGEGIGLLTGASGTGKSLICQCLYEEFLEEGEHSDIAQAVLLQPGRLRSPVELDTALLSGLGMEFPTQSSEGVVRAVLEQFLITIDRGILVIVDPADRLSLRVWEEIQSLAGFSHSGRVPLRWILSGSPFLEEQLSHPHLGALNQRIAVRANLRNWNATEVREYMRTQLRAAKGIPEQFFTESGEHQIHRLTDGVPRLVNLLCDRILWHSLCEDVIGPFDISQIRAIWNEIEGIAPATLTNGSDEFVREDGDGPVQEEP